MSRPVSDRLDKLERLANLCFLLLDARRPLTLQEICDSVAGYPAANRPEARRQAFERDKRALRDEGISITVKPVANDSQLGYQIRPDDFYLPDLDLTAEEQAALNVAVAGVHLDDSSGRDALSKLGIAAATMPVPVATLPSLAVLPEVHAAIAARAPLEFSYRGKRRSVDPYGLLCRGGAWYVIGWDHARNAQRTFRVDRIESGVTVGEPESFDVPRDFDPSEQLPEAPWQLGEETAVTAVVRLESDIAPLIVAAIGDAFVREEQPDGTVDLSMEVSNRDAFRSWILSLGVHARVMEPQDLVDDVVGWLAGMAGK